MAATAAAAAARHETENNTPKATYRFVRMYLQETVIMTADRYSARLITGPIDQGRQGGGRGGTYQTINHATRRWTVFFAISRNAARFTSELCHASACDCHDDFAKNRVFETFSFDVEVSVSVSRTYVRTCTRVSLSYSRFENSGIACFDRSRANDDTATVRSTAAHPGTCVSGRPDVPEQRSQRT